MFFEFELSYNAAEATKIICCVKGEDAVNKNNQIVHEISCWL